MVSNKKGEISAIAFLMTSIVVVVLGSFVLTYTADTQESIDNQYLNASNSSIYLTTRTLSPSGNQIDGTPVAKTYNQTWLEFDGQNDWMNLQDSSNINLTDEFTIVFWANPNHKSNYLRMFGVLDKFEVMYSNDADQQIRLVIKNSTTSANVDSGVAVPVDSWSSFAVTYDGITNKYFGVYTNGGANTYSSVGSMTGNMNMSGNNFSFGQIQGVTSWYNGSYDEIRVYNKSLTARQIIMLQLESSRELGKSIPILSYHYIDEDNSDSLTVNLTDFREQMDVINKSDIIPITYKDLYDASQGDYVLPERPVIISFDDGYKDTLTNASTIMDDYGFVGVVAVITHLIGDSGYLTWDDVTNLSNQGWEIASHSINTTNMENINDISSAMTNSRNDILGNISVTPTSFVYPQNAHNATIDSTCGGVYSLCTGDHFTVNVPNWTYLGSSLVGDVHRIQVLNTTTSSEFDTLFNYYTGLVANIKLNENSVTTAYDVSGNGNNGTITGASWNNDGVLNTLTNNVDYSVSGNQFTLNNSDYEYSFLQVTWDYIVDRNLSNNIGLRLAQIFIALIVVSFIAGYVIKKVKE